MFIVFTANIECIINSITPCSRLFQVITPVERLSITIECSSAQLGVGWWALMNRRGWWGVGRSVVVSSRIQLRLVHPNGRY